MASSQIPTDGHVEGNSVPAEPAAPTAIEAGEVDDGHGDTRPSLLRVDSDGDSAIADIGEFGSSTASISSSLYEKVEENGRTYHKYKEGSYLLPNDELEQNRLDLQHKLWKATFRGKLFLAPIKDNPQNVLDLGTGTGVWAIEFAYKHPSASVLGTDLSPIQPLYVPPNCRFEVDDFEDEWLYSQKFDFIHGRALSFAFRHPGPLFHKAFHALAPGGYMQMADAALPLRCIDDSLHGTALWSFELQMTEGARMLGKDVTHAPMYKSYMEAAGFVDVVEEQFQWPINTWPKGRYHKTVGTLFNQDMVEGLSGIAMAVLTRAYKMTPEEVEALLVEVKKDLNDKAIHAYEAIYVVYGRKPM